MNVIIPPYIVAWMRNITATVISLALIWIFTPMYLGLAAGIVFFAMSLICFLITMIATKKEILVGIFFALIYSSVDALKKRLDYDYLAQHEYSAQHYGLLDFFGSCLFYSLFSLIGTVPVYLWRRWRRKM